MGASQVMPVVKNPLANAGDIKDAGLIPVEMHTQAVAVTLILLLYQWYFELSGAKVLAADQEEPLLESRYPTSSPS